MTFHAAVAWSFGRVVHGVLSRQSLWRTAVSRMLAVPALLSCASCEGMSFRIGDPNASIEEMVADMLPDLERLSGLPSTGPVKVARRSEAEVETYIEQRLDTYLPADQLEGMRRSYVMFGLLPDTLDLRGYLLALYSEQVAGFYDPLTTTLYVVEGAAPGTVQPVLAHELVHALQDQHANLDSLITRPGENDRQTAAQSAIEGHATLTMFAWLAEAATGQSIDPVSLPDPSASIGSGFTDARQFPVFANAPRILRETLLFPYARGASFVLALWRTATVGRVAPFGALMPRSTEQVMYPLERFMDEADEPTELRFEAVDGWTVAYENTLGALETAVFLEEALGPIADASRGWDGDRYLLLEAGADRVLDWATIWDDAVSADLFEERVRAALAMPARAFGGTVERTEHDGRPLVRVRIGHVPALAGLDEPAVHCVTETGVRTACGAS